MQIDVVIRKSRTLEIYINKEKTYSSAALGLKI